MANIDVITEYNCVKIEQSEWYNSDPDKETDWCWFGNEEQSYDDYERKILDHYLNKFTKHLKCDKQKLLNTIAGFKITDIEYEYDAQAYTFTISIDVENLADAEDEVDEQHLRNLADTVIKKIGTEDHAHDFQQACFDWWLDHGVCLEANNAVERMLENNIVEAPNPKWGFDTLQRVESPTPEQIQKTIDRYFSWGCSHDDDAETLCELVEGTWGFKPKIPQKETA